MPSLNVDLNYFDHIKTMRLVARLGPGSDVLPIKLWAYVGKQQPAAGSVEMLAEELEHAIGWWGEKGAATSAMIEIGFVTHQDGKWYVHDWFEHSGHLAAFKKRAVKAARKRWGIKRKTGHATSIAKGVGKQCSCSTVHSSAVHNNTPLPPAGGFHVGEAFEKTWKVYPKERRVGKKAAWRSYQKSVKDVRGAVAVADALENYLKSETATKDNGQFIKNASTFFANWEDYKNDDAGDISGSGGPMPDGQTAGGVASDGVAPETQRALGKLSDSKAFPR